MYSIQKAITHSDILKSKKIQALCPRPKGQHVVDEPGHTPDNQQVDKNANVSINDLKKC